MLLFCKNIIIPSNWSKVYRFLISITIVSLYCYSVFAQTTQVAFLGSIMVNGGKSYPYKLFVNDSGGMLTGYSVSDIAGADETKTLISGRLNASKKQLTFRETKIAYTKSATEMCYIHATLKAGKMQRAATMRGHFKGYRADGKTPCGNGKIMLVCADDILNKLLEIAHKDSLPQPSSNLTNNYTNIPINEAEITKILPGHHKELRCNSATVEIEIWDAKSNDGDIITLLQDGKPLLEEHKITYRHNVLRIDIADKGSTELRLIAISEGSEPLNTARIKITSGGQTQYVDASTSVGNDVIIVLKK